MSDTPTIAECFEEIRFASEEAKESRPWEIWSAFDEAVDVLEVELARYDCDGDPPHCFDRNGCCRCGAVLMMGGSA